MTTARETAPRSIPARGSITALACLVYRSAFPLVPFLVALLIFQSPLQLYAFVGACAFFVLRWLAEGSPFPSTTANLFLVLLLGALAWGMVTASSQEDAIRVAGHVVAGVIALSVIQDWGTRVTRLWVVVALLVLLGVAFALAAPFTTVWMPDKLFLFPEFYDYPFPRFGELSLANNVAGGLEPVVPLALALIASGRLGWRLLGALALPILLVMLVLLQCRSALLAVGIGFTVYLALYRRWLVPLIPLTLLGGLYLNNLMGGVIQQGTLALKNMSIAPETIQGRLEIWRHALLPFARAPLGLGLGGFHKYASSRLVDVLAEPQRAHAHNLFLQVGLDLGVVALAAFIGLWVSAVRAAWGAYRTAELNALAIGILSAFAVIFTHGMFDVIFWGAKPGILMWAILGVALALARFAPEPVESPRAAKLLST